jgi:hypothetical protein
MAGRPRDPNRCEKEYQKDLAKRERNKARKRAYVKLRGECCEICGTELPYLDMYCFHHVDEATKVKELGQQFWTKYMGKPGGSTWEEAEKCIMCCPNCHSLEHILLEQGKTLLSLDYVSPGGVRLVIPKVHLI